MMIVFRNSKSTHSLITRYIRAEVVCSSVATAKLVQRRSSTHFVILSFLQIFRFGTSKSESLFAQRKNPRKIAWTVPYRRMHKKGITEETAKKRSRRTVKHQRGIVGADLAAIVAKRTQSTQVRTQQRLAAISKAKAEKKEKEAKKPKVRQTTSHDE
jgi:hypothetical protein